MEGLVNIESLRAFIMKVFIGLGVSETDSRMAADVLIFADQRGIRSHGVSNLDQIYVKKICCNLINPAATSQLIVEDQATALIDGQFGLGLVVATQAMDLAIEKARAHGAAVVAVRNSSHFGCASFYSARAMAANMIGIAMSNLGSQVIARPPDGQVSMLGTNPFSIVAPAANLPPFALDMSTTVVATGHLRVLAQLGEQVPAGWLVDDYDNVVTDPARFFERQAHLQMLGGKGSSGGYKGYGLALAVDVLAGLLAGARVGPDPSLLQPGGTLQAAEQPNIGHLFVAIDIERFRPINEFRNAMDRMLGALLDCPSRADCDPVVYPGYPEACATMQPPADSVAIDLSDISRLSQIAAEFGLSFPKFIPSHRSGATDNR